MIDKEAYGAFLIERNNLHIFHMTDKKQLTEQDIRTKYITPALKNAGWNEITQLREEVYFTVGRIEVRGKIVKRGEAKKLTISSIIKITFQ
jgi:type I site-specific restriction endonuclease